MERNRNIHIYLGGGSSLYSLGADGSQVSVALELKSPVAILLVSAVLTGDVIVLLLSGFDEEVVNGLSSDHLLASAIRRAGAA